MMFLPGLAVIFAGLLGGHGDIDKQVTKVFRDLHVKAVKLPAASLQKLTHHGEATRDLVRSLNADGVIACEVVKGESGSTLRIVIYEHDGRLKTFSEVPLTAKGLSRDSLDVLRSNVGDDIASMQGTAPEPEPEIEIDPVPAKPAKPIVVAKPAKPEKPIVVAKLDKPAAKPVKAKDEDHIVISDDVPTNAGVDDEDPLAGKKQNVRKPTAETKPAAEPKPTAEPTVAATETAAADDAVSADEIAALTANIDDVTPVPAGRSLHFGASAGIGIASRSFSPGPATVAAYSSAPVAAIVLDARIQPTQRLAIAIGTERSLQLSTPMSDGTNAATTISQWEAGGTYAFVQRPRFDLGARFGGGRRAFTIDSVDPARSPDSDYNYLTAGVDAAARVGSRVTLRTTAAFEPVLFGAEPTEMAFGEASRWALELGAAVEVRATNHIFMRATAQYQRFSWSWDMAGERGAGGAIDEYPSGALAIGADY
ncbi:MAG TPA: hypothetical protein VFV99_22940 [Kofleriaceae bacterium]|nr:hypothetical protein [Kofleriaceae bacterium]